MIYEFQNVSEYSQNTCTTLIWFVLPPKASLILLPLEILTQVCGERLYLQSQPSVSLWKAGEDGINAWDPRRKKSDS